MSVEIGPSHSGKNVVLREVPRHKEEELTRGWRTLHEEEIRKTLVMIMKSRNMGWTWIVARIG
jgi:hypothetical protein